MDWDIIGHEWAVRLLQNHIRSGRRQHAYLFTGPQGVGRRTLALRLAQALNCPSPQAPGIPCGVCTTCRQIAALQHPDLYVIEAERSGGTLKVEQIRELQHNLALAPYAGAYKIALLLRFEEAHPSAANALLKTLEEPPPRVILLLTASDPDALLPTIVSRCEVLRLRPLAVETLSQALQNQRQIPPETARLVAHTSDGRPGYAIRLHERPEHIEARRQALATLFDLLPANRVARFAAAETLAAGRDTLSETLLLWLSLWRDVLLCSSGARLPLTNLDYEAQIRALGAALPIEAADACLKSLQITLERIEKNVNPRLALEVFLLDMPRLAGIPEAA
ncbi:MAG: DNA polymerase III subunit delta' [Anaerolineales bacterium]